MDRGMQCLVRCTKQAIVLHVNYVYTCKYLRGATEQQLLHDIILLDRITKDISMMTRTGSSVVCSLSLGDIDVAVVTGRRRQ